MAVLNMSAAQQAFKIFYLPGLQYQLNNASAILANIDRDSESVVGSEIHIALRYGRQGGVGNRADDGALPTPKSRQTQQAIYQTKNIFAQVQITDKAMKASRSREGAFMNLLEADLTDAQDDAKDNLSRQIFGDGTGLMTTITAVSAGTVITVANTFLFSEGQIIDICTAANNGTAVAGGAGLYITAVDDTNSQITVSAAVTVAVNNIITIAGNYNQELTGFGAMFQMNNTIYNVNRATNMWLNPTIQNIAGELSEVGMQKARDEAERKAGGNIDFWSGSYGVRRAYQNLLLAQKQIIEPMQLEGGYEALSYNGKPFTIDKYNPPNTLFGLDRSTWKMYEIEDWGWLEDDGAILSRVPGYPVWAATLARYCDLGCSKPRANVMLTNITEH